MAELGELYRQRREAVTALVADLSDEDASRLVPTCPAWTVHDVVAHLVGVAVDGTSDNMAGAPGDAWTAAQVEARRGRPIPAILEEWERVAPLIEGALRGPMASPAVADVASHEQDIRTALGRPGERDNDAIRAAVGWFIQRFGERLATAGLPAVRVITEDGEHVAGDGEPAITLDATRFDLFRAALGRRSAAQIEGMFTGGDPAPYLDSLIIFGPSETDIHE